MSKFTRDGTRKTVEATNPVVVKRLLAAGWVKATEPKGKSRGKKASKPEPVEPEVVQQEEGEQKDTEPEGAEPEGTEPEPAEPEADGEDETEATGDGAEGIDFTQETPRARRKTNK